MIDYLERIAGAKTDIARLKGKKEAFEQSNVPDDLDEEEAVAWNYARDLDRQMRELKTENREELRELARLERVAEGARATEADRSALAQARVKLLPVLDQLAALEDAFLPYEQVKEQLAEARTRYRKLTDEFVNELKSRCSVMTADEKCVLVLELFAQDVQAGFDAAVSEKRQELVRFLEGLWDKYRVTLNELRNLRAGIEHQLTRAFSILGYA